MQDQSDTPSKSGMGHKIMGWLMAVSCIVDDIRVVGLNILRDQLKIEGGVNKLQSCQAGQRDCGPGYGPSSISMEL